MKCKECGQEFIGDAMFCGKCGSPRPGRNKIKCANCNNEIDGGLEYCPRCGEHISGDDKKRDEDDDDENGGIFGAVGDIIGKLFG